jgi:RES domain-containing protein
VALSVAAIAVRGRWVKHTYPGSPPLPERDPPPDNRWQRGEVVDALYLADTEETAWAEWYRHLAERMIPPLAQMPRELWTWQVDVEVADLSTPEHLAEIGLELPSPGDALGTPTSESASNSQRTAGRGCSRQARRAQTATFCASSATSTALSAPSRSLPHVALMSHLHLPPGSEHNRRQVAQPTVFES